MINLDNSIEKINRARLLEMLDKSDTQKHEFRFIPAKQSGVYLNLDDSLVEV